jgi:hypothetical protein
MATARDTTLLRASVCVIRKSRGPMLVVAVVVDVARFAPAVDAPECGVLRPRKGDDLGTVQYAECAICRKFMLVSPALSRRRSRVRVPSLPSHANARYPSGFLHLLGNHYLDAEEGPMRRPAPPGFPQSTFNARSLKDLPQRSIRSVSIVWSEQVDRASRSNRAPPQGQTTVGGSPGRGRDRGAARVHDRQPRHAAAAAQAP